MRAGGGGGGGDDGKREKGLSSLFSLPIVPRALSFFFSFQPPYDAKSPISRGKSLYGART